MDGDRAALEARLTSLLQELATVKVELDRGEPGEIPHYSEIETSAHTLGRRLSQAIQQERMLDLAGSGGSKAQCPDCGCYCQLELEQRTITSMDGPADVSEPVAHCKRCQRSFFPSA
jgi:hypothetical protein